MVASTALNISGLQPLSQQQEDSKAQQDLKTQQDLKAARPPSRGPRSSTQLMKIDDGLSIPSDIYSSMLRGAEAVRNKGTHRLVQKPVRLGCTCGGCPDKRHANDAVAALPGQVEGAKGSPNECVCGAGDIMLRPCLVMNKPKKMRH